MTLLINFSTSNTSENMTTANLISPGPNSHFQISYFCFINSSTTKETHFISRKTKKGASSHILRNISLWTIMKDVDDLSESGLMENVCSLHSLPFRSCFPIDPQTPGDGQSRDEHCSSEFLSWLTWGMQQQVMSTSVATPPHTELTHNGFTFPSVMHWLSVSLFCPSVPRWNHQKHQRGSGDNNLWPFVLPAGRHRLGYERSRDPHRISERGESVKPHVFNTINKINLSHVERCRKYVAALCSEYLFF